MNTAVFACEANGLCRNIDTRRRSHLVLNLGQEEPVGAADFEYIGLRPIRDEHSQRFDAVTEVEAETLFLGHVIKILVPMEVIRPIQRPQLVIGDIQIGRDEAACTTLKQSGQPASPVSAATDQT